MSPPPASSSSFLSSRRTLFVLAGLGCAQLALTATGLPAWQCPFRTACGIPCPGCGLTRATVALLHGDWRHALTLHAFSPLVVLALAGFALFAFLPATPRARFGGILEQLNTRFRLGWVLLGALLIYWIARFFLDVATIHQLAA